MSSVMAQARARVPRSARAAVERARLTVVPVGRTQAKRTPFAVLVLGLLAAGVVGLLMFNTHMQQASFYATHLEQQATSLTAKEQSLDMALDRLRDPQQLAVRAKKLGMVAPSVPAFIDLADGRIVGHPASATPEDTVLIRGAPAPKPRSLAPAPIIVTVKAPAHKSPTHKTATHKTTGPGRGADASATTRGTHGATASGTNQGASR